MTLHSDSTTGSSGNCLFKNKEHDKTSAAASLPSANVDSARHNLAPTFVNAYVNADFSQSGEDLELKEKLELYVEKVQDPNPELQRAALVSMRQEIRASSPKPLKFLSAHYGTLKAFHLTMPDSDLKKYLSLILSVLALTMYEEGERSEDMDLCQDNISFNTRVSEDDYGSDMDLWKDSVSFNKHVSEDEFSSDDDEEYSDARAIGARGPETQLYWNLEHYPIPENADLDSIMVNIKLALHRMGIHGCLTICAYGDKPTNAKCVKYDYDFSFTPPQGGGKSTAAQIARDILCHAFKYSREKPSLVVLSEDYPELHRVLVALQSRNHYVLEILSTAELGAGLFDSVGSVHGCTWFLDGVPTKRNTTRNTFKPKTMGPKTGVFWDTVDYPFPYGACMWIGEGEGKGKGVYQKIISALCHRGVVGPILISSYPSSHGVTPTLSDERPTRLENMLNDILLWAIDNPHDSIYSSTLVVVADVRYLRDGFLDILEFISDRSLDVYLVAPSKGTNPESPDWPGRLCAVRYD